MKKIIMILITAILLSAVCVNAAADNLCKEQCPCDNASCGDCVMIDNAVVTNPMYAYSIGEKIKFATEMYDVITQEIHAGRWERLKTNNGRVEVSPDGYGVIRRVSVVPDTDSSQYARFFYYDESENLVFAFYDNRTTGVQERAYFDNWKMLQWKHTAADKTVSTKERENSTEYFAMEAEILSDSAKYLSECRDTVNTRQRERSTADKGPIFLDHDGEKADKNCNIPEKALAAMKETATKKLNENIASSWNKWENLVSSKYTGSYLLTNKNDFSDNYVGVIFKNTVHICPPDCVEGRYITYFYTMTFRDLVSYADGNWKLDLTNYTQPEHQINVELEKGHRCNYRGFATEAEFIAECIDPYLRDYVRTCYTFGG